MWRILRFLGRFGNFLLFLFLEVVALIVVITANQPQREISQGIFLELSGSMAETRSAVTGYFGLIQENERVMGLNADLERRLQLLQDSLNVLMNRVPKNLNYMVPPDSIRRDTCALQEFVKRELPDSLMPLSSYKFIPAMTINNTVDRTYNYITLNMGSNHGIKPDMGVISPDGIAGQIVKVSPNYSLAMSVLNAKYRPSAKLLRISNVGALRWEGEHADRVYLDYIPQTSQIKIGDTVVTSGYSSVFPPNYMIGTVVSANTDSQDGFFKIEVSLSTNFRALHNVFIVRAGSREELDSLEASRPGI